VQTIEPESFLPARARDRIKAAGSCQQLCHCEPATQTLSVDLIQYKDRATHQKPQISISQNVLNLTFESACRCLTKSSGMPVVRSSPRAGVEAIPTAIHDLIAFNASWLGMKSPVAVAEGRRMRRQSIDVS
jgi:hypothetical protein